MLKIPLIILTRLISAVPISASFKNVRSRDQDGLQAMLDIGGAINYLCKPQMEKVLQNNLYINGK